MRPNQQKNRSRGRNGGRKHINPLSRNFESNGPDVKVRGNAAHIAEKYQQLARDANASGDTVMAENYLQHAEHYFRIVMAAQTAQQNFQRGDQFSAPDDMDDDDDFPPINDRFSIPERVMQPEPQHQPQQHQPQPQPQQQYNRQPEAAEGEPATDGDSQPQAERPQREAGAEGDGEPRRYRDRRRRRGPARAAEDGNGNADPGNSQQPDLPDLPAFITASGGAE